LAIGNSYGTGSIKGTMIAEVSILFKVKEGEILIGPKEIFFKFLNKGD
jgi:hypothetical protein